MKKIFKLYTIHILIFIFIIFCIYFFDIILFSALMVNTIIQKNLQEIKINYDSTIDENNTVFKNQEINNNIDDIFYNNNYEKKFTLLPKLLNNLIRLYENFYRNNNLISINNNIKLKNKNELNIYNNNLNLFLYNIKCTFEILNKKI